MIRHFAVATLAAASLAAVTAPFSAPARAQEAGPYLGVSFGQSRVNLDTAAMNADLSSVGVRHTGFTTDESDTGWKLYAGYRFSPHFAVEGGLVQLGEFAARTSVTGVGAVNAPGTASITAKTSEGLHVSALGILPLGEQFHFFGRVGLHSIKTEATAVVTGPLGSGTVSSSDRSSDLLLGLGFGFDLTRALGLRAEWERYTKIGDEDSIGTGDVDLISVGIVVRF